MGGLQHGSKKEMGQNRCAEKRETEILPCGVEKKNQEKKITCIDGYCELCPEFIQIRCQDETTRL
jgi:hypothetical protein